MNPHTTIGPMTPWLQRKSSRFTGDPGCYWFWPDRSYRECAPGSYLKSRVVDPVPHDFGSRAKIEAVAAGLSSSSSTCKEEKKKASKD